jgi:2-hydroxy-3-keto-5-methylthiopentenyl-1-phosphate phosphatase
MTHGVQEVLDETWIMPILRDPDGTLQASDQPDEIRRQIGDDEVGIDATQLLSQMLSDHIAKNNGVGWPELGASHKKGDVA